MLYPYHICILYAFRSHKLYPIKQTHYYLSHIIVMAGTIYYSLLLPLTSALSHPSNKKVCCHGATKLHNVATPKKKKGIKKCITFNGKWWCRVTQHRVTFYPLYPLYPTPSSCHANLKWRKGEVHHHVQCKWQLKYMQKKEVPIAKVANPRPISRSLLYTKIWP
jgi:hypothetical protein